MSAVVTEPKSTSVSTRRPIDFDGVEPLGDRFGDLALLGLLGIELLALALDLLLVALGDQQSQLAGQQVVAGVAIGDLHHFAAASDVVDVLSKNDFHIVNPSHKE
jgi:hypothetical protein